MSIKDVRQNAYSASSHSLRQFVNKINVSKDYDNKQPDPKFTFIHERDFMVQFLLANGQSFEGITTLLNANTNGSGGTGSNNATTNKEQPKYLPGDYMTEFLTESNGSEYWDFYLKSINIPNIIQGSSRVETLDDGSNMDYSPNFDFSLISNGTLTTDEKEVTMNFYDSEISFVDGFIIPWAQSMASPIGTVFSYKQNDKTLPSSRFNYFGTLIVYQLSSVSGSIIREWYFRNIRPKIINTPDFDREKGLEISTREVVFAFDRVEYYNYKFGTKNKVFGTMTPEERRKQREEAKKKAEEEANRKKIAAEQERKARNDQILAKTGDTKAAARVKAKEDAEKKAKAEAEQKRKEEELKNKDRIQKQKALEQRQKGGLGSTESKNVSVGIAGREKTTWWDRNGLW